MIFSENALKGRVDLIIGGATGIGFGIAKAYAACGAKLVIASRNLERLQEAKSTLENEGAEVHVVQMDVRDFEAVTHVINEAVERFGGLDIVIANAAGNFVVPAEEMSPNAWKAVIDIDLNSTFSVLKRPLSNSSGRNTEDALLQYRPPVRWKAGQAVHMLVRPEPALYHYAARWLASGASTGSAGSQGCGTAEITC